MEYRYSTHKSLEQAQAALEDYYARDEVSPCEYSRIVWRDTPKGRMFDIMLLDY